MSASKSRVAVAGRCFAPGCGTAATEQVCPPSRPGDLEPAWYDACPEHAEEVYRFRLDPRDVQRAALRREVLDLSSALADAIDLEEAGQVRRLRARLRKAQRALAALP